jgi:hypothetical protein
MTQQISNRWNKPDYFVDKVPDSKSGELISVRRDLCNHCGEYIYNPYGHPACIRKAQQDAVMEEQKWQDEQDIQQFGHVIHDPTERLRRLYPNEKVMGYQETWNQELARKEKEKKEAAEEEVRQNAGRKVRLSKLLEEVEWLKKQIEADNDTR